MDIDIFMLRLNTKNVIKDLQNVEDLFDFSNLMKNHELFSIKKQRSDW